MKILKPGRVIPMASGPRPNRRKARGCNKNQLLMFKEYELLNWYDYKLR